MEARWRELPFWQLEYRRVEGEPLLRSMWGYALLGAQALVLAALFGLAFKQGFASPYLALTALIVAHLLARGQLEQQLPNPSFLRDLQTGHLDQFRMLDLTPHALLLQRGLPALFYRLQNHILWLPLYVAWGAWAGVPGLESVLLWLLFAFAEPLVLILLSFYLTLSFIGVWELVTLALLVFGYGSLREVDRARFGFMSGWLFALLIGLPILLRLLIPMAWMYTLPDTGQFALVWLMVEGLRWERRARWLNMPSGLWRWGWLLPTAGLLLMVFSLVWEWTPLWNDAQRLQVSAILVFLMASWLNTLLLTTVRGRDPVQQRWAMHLHEVALVRALSVVAVFIGAFWYGVGFGSNSFWVLWLLLTLVDVPLSGLYRLLLQRAYCMRMPLGRLALLELAPILWFLFAPDRYAMLGVLSPLVALATQTPLWGLVVRQPPPPFPLLLAMPLLWRGLMLAIAWLWVSGEWRIGSNEWSMARLQRVLTLVLIYPLYDWLCQHLVTNPATRFFIMERRFDAAPLLAGLGWLLGLAIPSGNAIGWALLIIMPVLVALWWTGYRVASQRVQRLVETGELRQWFLTGLAPFTIYWGLVVSVWLWQTRLLIALYGCGVLAAWFRAFYEAFTNKAALGAPVVVAFAGGIATFTFVAILVLLCSQLLLAAPVAIQDTLIALGRRERPSMARATLLSLVYSGCAVLTCIFAPILLAGLPFYSARSERILRQLARAPDEYLQRLPMPVR